MLKALIKGPISVQNGTAVATAARNLKQRRLIKRIGQRLYEITPRGRTMLEDQPC